MNVSRHEFEDWSFRYTRTHDVPWKRCDSRHRSRHVVTELPPTFSHSRPASLILPGLALFARGALDDFMHNSLLHVFPRSFVAASFKLPALSEINNPSTGRIVFHEV